MTNMNMIIAGNILELLKSQGKRQADLAEAIGMPRQTVSKMLSGNRSISAIELKKIAGFFGVSMDNLVRIPEVLPDHSIVPLFMGRVNTDGAREAIKIADEISDLILFHKRVRENASKMARRVGDE